VTLRARLQQIAGALPPGGSVTLTLSADELAELCDGPVQDGALELDLTVGQVAALFGRGESTVRTWIGAGLLPGAYLLRGREWRVPRAAVRELQRKQAEEHGAPGASVSRRVVAR
jgi:excisionase family DNA binding protein